MQLNFRSFVRRGTSGSCAVRLGLLAAFALLPFAISAGVRPDRKPGGFGSLGDHYLMVVAGNRDSSLTVSQLQVLNASPYDGMGVRFLDSYDTGPIPSAEEMSAKLLQLKKSTEKDLWPWVSFNRMVGRDPAMDTPYGRDAYFTRFSGIDLDGAAGAQNDFVSLWRNSLRTAKQTHAPGLVADLEFYINNKANDPTLLSKQIGKPVEQTISLLHGLGARLADTAADAYPTAVIWFMYTALGQEGWKVDGNIKYYPTPAYVVMGLLDEIREKQYNLKIISGGEIALEYCSFSRAHLQHKIDVRAKDFAPHLRKYGGSLALAGTMILWPDRASKTGFVATGACSQSDANTVEDQETYLELLFRTYRYNWIYGTNNSGYDPFNPAIAPRFNAVLRKAKASAEKDSPR
jgi:hypothetical protein